VKQSYRCSSRSKPSSVNRTLPFLRENAWRKAPRHALASGKWAGKKIDLAIDTAIRLAFRQPALFSAPSIATNCKRPGRGMTWLDIVAHKL